MWGCMFRLSRNASITHKTHAMQRTNKVKYESERNASRIWKWFQSNLKYESHSLLTSFNRITNRNFIRRTMDEDCHKSDKSIDDGFRTMEKEYISFSQMMIPLVKFNIVAQNGEQEWKKNTRTWCEYERRNRKFYYGSAIKWTLISSENGLALVHAKQLCEWFV